MRRLLVIGIGAGDPRLMTIEAGDAIGEVEVFLVVDKGETKDDLVAVRRQMLRTFARGAYRTIEIHDPPRDPALPYREAVQQWHHQRVLAFERALSEQVADGECAGLLVWGDPSLYDSTLRIIDQVLERGRVAVDHRVFPGISSVQVLAARHRIPLNQIGGSVLITTGRRLREGLPDGIEDVVVMLDGDTAFTTLTGQGFDIYWGAYLASADELLIAGPLDEVADQIVKMRAEARRRRGWIFDTYLLRRQQG